MGSADIMFVARKVTRLLPAVYIVIGALLIIVQAQNTDFSFLSFDASDRDRFEMVGDVQHDATSSSFLMNPTGVKPCARLLYNKTVRMKDSASRVVASFRTAFTFRITCAHVLSGHGFAFTFARDVYLANVSPGPSLCLLNAKNDGRASNRVFAVEFDTFYNDNFNSTHEPSDSHIGVNINSVHSIASHNLCANMSRVNCRVLCDGGFFTAWIDYDSASSVLEVFFDSGSLYDDISKPATPVIQVTLLSKNGSVLLDQLVDDYMYAGFSSAIGAKNETNHIHSWMLTTSIGLPEKAQTSLKWIMVGSSIGGTVVFFVALILYIRWKNKHRLRVFISHSGGQEGVNKNFAISLWNALRSTWRLKWRFRAFIDCRNLSMGVPFPDDLRKELEATQLAIVVVTEEFFTRSWPMQELVEMVRSQSEKSVDSVRILPLFFGFKPRCIRTGLRDGRWRERWMQMAIACGINPPEDAVQEYEAAVEKLRELNGVVYDYSDRSHEEEYLRRILKEVNQIYLEMRKNKTTSNERGTARGPERPNCCSK